MPEYRRRTRLSHPPEAVWAWHLRDGAFERLQPRWERFRIDSWAPVAEGSVQRFRIRKGLWWRWEALIDEVVEGHHFRDVQTRGPFARWEHTHTFEPDGEEGAILDDTLNYALPLGRLGQLVAGRGIHRSLDATFRFRHERTRHDLDRHRAFAAQPRLRIAITGAGGLVGSSLVAFLRGGGHQVCRLVRRPGREEDEISWDPSANRVDLQALEGIDAVIHLSGAPIATRWTEASKAEMRRSRIDGTKTLCEALAKLDHKPRVLISASAVGFYGDRADEVLTETSPPGQGFLATLCEDWEAATAPADEAGIRVVHLRTGVVLDPRGGALEALLPLFRLGLGGPVGSGRQYVPWIALDDLVGLIHHALFQPELAGPVNGTAPEPVPQRQLARTLGRVLRRPAFLPVPATALRLALGEMADEVLLYSQRALPTRATDTGFLFRHDNLEGALRFVLGRDGGS